MYGTKINYSKMKTVKPESIDITLLFANRVWQNQPKFLCKKLNGILEYHWPGESGWKNSCFCTTDQRKAFIADIDSILNKKLPNGIE